MNSFEKKVVAGGLAAVLAIAAAPLGFRKFNERNWPDSAKNTEYRHSFAAEKHSGAVSTVWETDTPDDLQHGDCSGSYMFVTQNEAAYNQKPSYTVEVAVFVDGQPDHTEEGRGPDKNFVYIGQLSENTLTPQARELYNFVVQEHFANKSYVLDRTRIVPIHYGEVQTVKGNSKAFYVPELNLVVAVDPKAKPGIGDASAGGMVTGSYTVQPSVVAPAGSRDPSMVLQR